VKPMDIIKNNFVNRHKALLISSFLTIIVTVAITLVLPLAWNFMASLMGWILRKIRSVFSLVGLAEPPELEAQGPSEALTAVSTLTGISSMFVVAAGSGFDTKTIKDNAMATSSLLRVALGTSTIAAWILALMPGWAQDTLVAIFGTKEEKEKTIMTNWMRKAVVALRLSKTPSVLTSDAYSKYVHEVMTEGFDLRRRLSSMEGVSTFVSIYVKLLSIQAVLIAFENERPTRPAPFSVHFSARPGVGKTLLAAKFIKDVSKARKKAPSYEKETA